MGLAWFIGFGFNFAITVPTSYVKDFHCNEMTLWPSLFVQRMTGVIIVCVEYFIPMIIIFVSYLQILMVLYSTRKSAGGAGMETSGGRNHSVNLAYKNTIRTLALVAFFFIVCWTGNQVYFFMFNIGYAMSWKGPVYDACLNLAYLNCVINPFVYVFNYRPFQERLKELLGVSKKSDDNSSVSLQTQSSVASSI